MSPHSPTPTDLRLNCYESIVTLRLRVGKQLLDRIPLVAVSALVVVVVVVVALRVVFMC